MAIVEEKKEKKFEEVLQLSDLANPKLPTGVASKLDVDADAYEIPVPPVAGRYNLRVALADDNPIKMRRTDDKDPNTTYYSIALECRIVSNDEAVNNRAIYAYVSSRMNRGQKISTLAYVLFKCGFPKEKLANKDVDQLTLVRGFVKWLSVERIVKDCLVDWDGYSKEQSKTIFRNMSQFPLNADGTREHIVSISTPGGGTEDITAKLNVKDWGEKPGEGTVQAGTGPKVRTAAPVAATETPDDDEVVIAAPKVTTIAPKTASATKKAMPPAPPPAPAQEDEDEDLEAMFGD